MPGPAICEGEKIAAEWPPFAVAVERVGVDGDRYEGRYVLHAVFLTLLPHPHPHLSRPFLPVFPDREQS